MDPPSFSALETLTSLTGPVGACDSWGLRSVRRSVIQILSWNTHELPSSALKWKSSKMEGDSRPPKS